MSDTSDFDVEEMSQDHDNFSIISTDEENLEKTSESIVSTTYRLYNRNNGLILILNNEKTVYFHGLFTLSVIQGEIEVLGHKITKSSDDIDLYSVRGSSLLYLKNTTNNGSVITDLYQEFGEIEQNSAIILCKPLNKNNILFIEKYMSQQILPVSNEKSSTRVVFDPKGSYNYIQVDDSWDRVIETVEKSTKLIICGGKGVGKTTLLKYAINKLLMKFPVIRVIDLDPGQSEFTIPGCISIVLVKKPIFGGSYSHLQDTERSVLSHINVSYEPQKYVESVRHLIKDLDEEYPTLVNFMGFTHGLGLNILSAAIVALQPTDVLQISSNDPNRNYPYHLISDVVKENANLFAPNVPLKRKYRLHQIESLNIINVNTWVAEPRQLREMSVLSYISRMVALSSISKVTGYLVRVNLSEIKITDLSGTPVHPAVVNANLVALCVFEAGVQFSCLGWGIVRGIDLELGYIVLVVEKTSILDQVTHLVSNGVNLPPSVYMTPGSVSGNIPYVMEGVLTSFGQIPKRSRIAVRK